MNFRKGAAREEPEINLIPLIDLFLVIIIFLMVTTTYSKFTELQITLPTADSQKALDRPGEINIAVSADGRYRIDGVSIRTAVAQELANVILQSAARKKDPVIIIAADVEAKHQSVITVMEAARIAQISQITFATQATSGK